MAYDNYLWHMGVPHRKFSHIQVPVQQKKDSSVGDLVTQKNLGFKDHIYNRPYVALSARVVAHCT